MRALGAEALIKPVLLNYSLIWVNSVGLCSWLWWHRAGTPSCPSASPWPWQPLRAVLSQASIIFIFFPLQKVLT